MRTALRFRRSPFLVSYWFEKQLVCENFVTRVRITVPPEALRILDFFHAWRTPEAMFRAFREYPAASLRKVLALLVRQTLLERSDRVSPVERAMQKWQPWSPAAAYFHFSTKDVQYVDDPSDADRSMRRQARIEPLPPAGKRVSGARGVPLPLPQTGGEFPRVLLERRTWRQFTRRPLELASLATLLGLTWGVQRWHHSQGIGRFALKTSPSGGALHSIEVYVVVRRVRGLTRGIYHYDTERHRLERVSARAPLLTRYLPGQRWYASAPALFLMTTVLARPLWKYRFPRAYRVILAEAGHLCQTFCLVATWLGLAPFCSMALADTRIEADLNVDGVGEAVLYAAGVGHRPPGEWSPWPHRRR
jgi:SagB-type dehydrogenase family enzyme